MQLLVASDGVMSCIYGEELDLASLGKIEIQRGSHVEPDSCGNWHVDLTPVNGPALGPFPKRSEALRAEVTWLESHWLLMSALIRP